MNANAKCKEENKSLLLFCGCEGMDPLEPGVVHQKKGPSFQMPCPASTDLSALQRGKPLQAGFWGGPRAA